MADSAKNGCSCGSGRGKNASSAVAPPPQHADVTPTATGTGRFVAAAMQTLDNDAAVTADATCPSPPPPPLPSRRNRPTPTHGAFRCHQTDGKPQSHARSPHAKGAMCGVVSRDTAWWWFSSSPRSRDFGFACPGRARASGDVSPYSPRCPPTTHRGRASTHRHQDLSARCAIPLEGKFLIERNFLESISFAT